MSRNALIALVHIGKKELGLDDATYRDMLRGITGKESASKMSAAELNQIADEMKRQGFKAKHRRAGKRKMATHPEARKMRALWMALYDLGIVADPRESALANHARKVTGGRSRGVEDIHWIKGQNAYKVIESLKAWAAREGDVDWSSVSELRGRDVVIIQRPQQRVIEAQWEIYARLKDNLPALPAIAAGVSTKAWPDEFDEHDFLRLQTALGASIRAAKANHKEAANG
ncbi:gp16 family protein [Sneathiella sp.]|uniref:gp16 family protein n=1 Tax=Sneathiella sp. TaxID=1964365 RepID=UPI002FE3A9AA